MTKQFDWILDPDLKAEIVKAWEEYQQDPHVWRLNKYLALIGEVPIDEEPENFKYDDPKYAVRFGDSHQPSFLDRW